MMETRSSLRWALAFIYFFRFDISLAYKRRGQPLHKRNADVVRASKEPTFRAYWPFQHNYKKSYMNACPPVVVVDAKGEHLIPAHIVVLYFVFFFLSLLFFKE